LLPSPGTGVILEETIMRKAWSGGLMLAATWTVALGAQTPRVADTVLAARVDSLVGQVLANSGVPSASVAVVRDGRLVYARAYGDARLEPSAAARPTMRYSIGSISKQFTAACILLLEQEGKLSLDDPVGRFLPDLTRAGDVTIRELLSHTSGYQDFWPQDYVPPMMRRPTTAAAIMDRWAKRPLDFDPGTRWQYSNTNYVIAGAIVEKAGGTPFFDFLRSRVLEPLGMRSAVNSDAAPLSSSDPTGYMRYALGPLRPAPLEGSGWMFAAGELAMTASDLARWDISLMTRSLLSPASYRALETEVRLKNGVGTGYGLGVNVGLDAGHRVLSHGGEVSGFTASNRVYPDDQAAVVVLTNQDAATAASAIAQAVGRLLFTTEDASTQAKTAEARRIFEGLQRGAIDRDIFTDDANDYFSDLALRDFASSLGPLGTPRAFVPVVRQDRGGMVERIYRVVFAQRALRVWTYELPNGKLEQYQVAVQN
jgi:D-alanyl-D-alanine carboxypeptidase